MVSSIIPGVGQGPSSANPLGVDPRYARAAGLAPKPANESAAPADRIDIGDAAQWRAARDSVRKGLAQLGEALAAGRDVYSLLNQISDVAQNPDAEGAQNDLSDAFDQLQKRVTAAVAQGVGLVAGDTLSVQAEPGAPDVVVKGVDLRLKDAPGANDAISIPRNATLANPTALGLAADKSLNAVQSGMERLLDAARALDAHQGFLGAAEGAVTGVRGDLDADAARLMALQVRQGLDGEGGGAIANVEPQAVLSLFKS